MKVLKITELSNKGNVKEKYEMFQVGDYYISWDLKHIKKNLGLGKYRIEEEESNSPRLDAIIENLIKSHENYLKQTEEKNKKLKELGIDKIFKNCLYREKNEIEDYDKYGYSRQPINMTYYLFTYISTTEILYNKYVDGKIFYGLNEPLVFDDLILVKENYRESQEFLLALKESFDIQKMAEKVRNNEIITSIEPVYDFSLNNEYQKYDGYKITTNKREILFLICGQDHSQTGVITTNANLKDFIGASFFGYTKVYSREIDNNFESDIGGNYIAFLNIHTSKGICDLAVHNSNNGYYGAEIKIVDDGIETREKDFGDCRQWQD